MDCNILSNSHASIALHIIVQQLNIYWYLNFALNGWSDLKVI